MSSSILDSRRFSGLFSQVAVSTFAVPLVAIGALMPAYKAPEGEGPTLTGYPPIISISKPQPDSATRYSQTTELRLDYGPDPNCDEPQIPDEPDPCAGDEATLQVWVNGVEKTSFFTTHGGWANSTSVELADTLWSTIRAKICNDFGCDEDTTWVYIDTKPAPEVSLLATDDQVRDRGLCAAFPAGPAASWACDDFVITHSTIPYYSLGKARGVTLIYSSQLAESQALISANVEFPWESTVPEYLGVRLKRGTTWVDPEIFLDTVGISTADSADNRRVTLVLKLGGVAPGLLDLTFAANSYYDSSSRDGDDSMDFPHDTVVATKIDRGWAIAGLARVQRLAGEDSLDLIWSDGAGTAHLYRRDGSWSFYKIEGVLAEMDTLSGSTAERTWRRTLPDGTLEYYNSSGQLSRIEGVNPADVTTFHYSGAIIDSIVDATGQKIEFRHNATGGRLSEIIYPGAAAAARDTTRLEYDVNGRLAKIYDPDGLYTEFSYDGGSKRITERKDRAGATTWYRWYDEDYVSRVERVVLATGSDSLIYAAPQLAALPDTTNGALSPANPDSTPPRPGEIEGSIENPRGYTLSFKVNEFGGLLEWVDALGRKTSYERDVNSLVTSRIGPDSVEFFWQRVGNLGLIRGTNDVSGDSVVIWIYPGLWVSLCPNGYPCHPMKKIHSRGYGEPSDTTVYSYAGNRLSHVTHPGGGTTGYSYQGSFSQLSKVTDPAGHKTLFEYDTLAGHLLRRFREWGGGSQGDSVTYWYDGKGRKIRETVDQSGGNYPYGKVFSEYEYDRLNRITKVHRVEGKYSGRSGYSEKERHTVTYAYDDTARTLRVTDPKAQSQLFEYDELGRVMWREDPAAARDTFTYDDNGNLASWITRRGQTITYTYDALDRLISKALPGGDTVSYGYHALRGTLDTIITPDAKNVFEFDARGRVLLDSSWVAGVSGGWKAVRYTYDAQGNLETLTDPWDSTYTYEPTPEPNAYGADFRYLANSWVDAFGDTTEWYYDTDGLLAKVGYANGVQDTVVKDERHRTTRIGSVTYTRGARGGRIDQMTVAEPDGDRVVKYTYDFKNQLTQEWDSLPGQAPVTRTFDYDSVGNRSGAGYKYDDANRLLATPADTLRYDDAGNAVWWKDKSTGDSTTFEWDGEGRLIEVKLYTSGGGSADRTVSFSYDGLGRRVKKIVTGDQTDTVRYVYDGSEVLAELDGSGSWTRRYTPHPTGVDKMIAVRVSSDSVYYLHMDLVGSVHKVTNASGDTVSRYRYEAFGSHAAVGTEGYASSFLWQGREYDPETGLYYFRARYYAPNIGRFLSEDPLEVIQGSNLYLFANNDAVNFRDPFGLSCTDIDDVEERKACENAEYLNWLVDMYVRTHNNFFLDIIAAKFGQMVLFGLFSWKDEACPGWLKSSGCGRWDYANRANDPAFGNYNFGYVGTAALGIPSYLLQNIGGADERIEDALGWFRGEAPGGEGVFLFASPYGDTKAGNSDIKRGIADAGRRR